MLGGIPEHAENQLEKVNELVKIVGMNVSEWIPRLNLIRGLFALRKALQRTYARKEDVEESVETWKLLNPGASKAE